MRPTLVLSLAVLVALPAAALVAVPSDVAAPLAGPGDVRDLGIATIHRDAYGIPHIFAKDLHGLFYANGYAQAQDRLWPMDVFRHISRGDAASVLGPGQLGSDISVRRGLYSQAQREAQFASLDAQDQAMLHAFADGVNRAMMEMTATGNLPAEFVLLNHAPEPWSAIDVVGVADLLLDHFGIGGGEEVSNAKLLDHLQAELGAAEGENAFDDVVQGVNHQSYTTIIGQDWNGPAPQPKQLQQVPQAQRDAAAAAVQAADFGVPEAVLGLPGVPSPTADFGAVPFGGLDARTIHWGSNALLVAPSLARDGRAMVGGGPQTGYYNPEFLWEVGLHGGGVDVVGAGVMGTPGVVLGRTSTFAWTVTSGLSDEIDMVALPADPAQNRSYLWDGASVPLACRTENHVVNTPAALGPAPPAVYQQEICESQVGPIYSWTRDGDGKPLWFFAAHKAHRNQEMAAAARWLGIDRATNLEEFRAAFEGFPFTFNFNYAGAEGACYHHVGVVPLRNDALDPRLPTPAGSAWDWSGSITGAALPRLCNQAQGYFANWNNLPIKDWPIGDNSEQWGSVHRVERLDAEVKKAVLASPDGKLDLAQVKDILQAAATHDPFAPAVIHEIDGDAAPAVKAALDAWAADDAPWADANGDGLYDAPGHAWYDAVRAKLTTSLFADELGSATWNPDPSASQQPGDHGEANGLDALLIDTLRAHTAHNWCDDIATPAVETCTQMVQAAFAAAGNPGLRPVHKLKFQSLGVGPGYAMNLTNRATYYHFHVGTDVTQSVSAMAPGNSAAVTLAEFAQMTALHSEAPPHMRDQLPLYVNFEFKHVPVTELQARAVAATTQLLAVPAAPV